MDIASFFRYSSANFENADVTESSFNVLETLNNDSLTINSNLDEEYQLRRQLYETNDNFFNSDHTEAPDGEDNEIRELKEQIKKGQNILKTEIQVYSELRDKLETIGQHRERFHENILAIKRNLLMLDDQDVVKMNDTHLNLSHNIHEQLKELDKKVSEEFDNQMAELKEDYTKSFRKLLQLKEVYKFCRQADTSFTCPICMQHPVSSYIIPCGHTYCRECLSNIRTRCYICRQTIDRIMNLYFT